VRRLLLIALFIEVGLILIAVPWSPYWDRNYFAEGVPAVRAVITNNFIRGAVSGLGLLNLCMAVSEIASIFVARPARTTVFASRPSEE
jgi:hypothetical protein